ncbi:Ger(x)C family spore germination protein [Ectobacillus antri]|uniref:Ger(X)C family spore germination protein n=1 Tax=Ectobacillus antri TaxID=2486280 RepID=A0ABT6H2N0_9BACI|nr:Ger(x)C family spore germination protein [Ectobacillus antri]MDG4656358.1 Ger(x)C family spore germination protein [Ectobacillus antri]MDG5753033.1 Ger(x)C family spore germination protein [Ectobacillus antri]
MKRLIIVLVCCTIILSGCIIKKRALETLGLATAIGLDREENDKVRGTIVLHHFGSKPEDVAQQLTSIADTSKGLFKYMNLETSDRLVTGQLRVAIYGKEYAEKREIVRQVETLKRDAATQTNMYLAISKTTAKDILYQPQEQEHSKNMGTYLYKMIQQNIEDDSVISCTVQEFLRDYYQVGRDPVLPLLEKRKDFVLIDGSALMYRGRLAGHITAAETFYIKALREGYKGFGSIDVKLPTEPFKKFYGEKGDEFPLLVNLQQVKVKPKLKLVQQNDPIFDVDVKMTANIAALSQPIDLGKPGVYKVFEKELGKKMEQHFLKEIEKMQNMKVDPIGFGAVYDASVRHLTLREKQWYSDLYPKTKFNIKLKLTIARSGVLN